MHQSQRKSTHRHTEEHRPTKSFAIDFDQKQSKRNNRAKLCCMSMCSACHDVDDDGDGDG